MTYPSRLEATPESVAGAGSATACSFRLNKPKAMLAISNSHGVFHKKLKQDGAVEAVEARLYFIFIVTPKARDVFFLR